MLDLNVIVILQWLLVVVLALPLVGAVGSVCLGRRSAHGARTVAYGFAFLHLGLTAILVGLTSFGLTSRGDNHDFNISMTASSAFRPMAVPGDPGHAGVDSSETSATGWALLRLAPPQDHAPPSDVQFYIGLDGLNVWLIGLTSLMTFIAVLISMGSIKDKPGAYYAWLFVLETAVIGAFAAFDVILFYVFFELTLIPTFFLIGNWGVGGGKRDAPRSRPHDDRLPASVFNQKRIPPSQGVKPQPPGEGTSMSTPSVSAPSASSNALRKATRSAPSAGSNSCRPACTCSNSPVRRPRWHCSPCCAWRQWRCWARWPARSPSGSAGAACCCWY